MLRIALIIFGVVLAAWGGVIIYRVTLLAPSDSYIVSGSGKVREVSHMGRIAGGTALFAAGAAIAFIAARRRA
ncbi:MAG: hypothetical protein ACRD9R_04405 [Pyrinomonadaceae bacterium]